MTTDRTPTLPIITSARAINDITRARKAAAAQGARYRGTQDNVDNAAAVWLRSLSRVRDFCVTTLGAKQAEACFCKGFMGTF